MIGVMQFRKLLDLVIIDFSESLEICLVASDGQGDSLRSVLLQLAHPFLNLFEALPRGDLIGDDGTKRLTVVDRCNSVVFLLSCCVLDGKGSTQMANLTVCLFSSCIFFSR